MEIIFFNLVVKFSNIVLVWMWICIHLVTANENYSYSPNASGLRKQFKTIYNSKIDCTN